MHTFVVVDCGPPEVPSHGQVSAETTVFNSQAHYSCDNCSDIMGVSTRICTPMGMWVPQAPTCQGIYVLHPLFVGMIECLSYLGHYVYCFLLCCMFF